MINAITNHNTDVIRSAMKEVSLLDVRDSLLIQCLRLPLSREGAAAIMHGFSFEWVAEKATFRDAHGLTHLLHMLHTFRSKPHAHAYAPYPEVQTPRTHPPPFTSRVSVVCLSA